MQMLYTETEFHAYLLDQIEEIVILTDLNEQVLYWNQGAERFYGIPAAAIMGKPHTKFFTYDWFTDADREEGRAALRRDGFWRGYLRCRQHGGAEWKLNASLKVVRDAAGEIIGHLSITHEMIKNTNYDLELQQTTNLLWRLTDRAPVFLWDSDPQGSPSYYNKVWLEFTGHTLEEELNGDWADAIHPDDLQTMITLWQEVRQAHQTFQMLYRVRRYDGVYRWLSGTSVPRFAPDGVLLGYVGAAFDVTEQKEQDASELARKRNEWELRQWETLGSMAGGIAHDFNNALAAIIGYADLAKSALPPYSKPFDDLERLQAAAQHAAILTRQMLDYSGQNLTLMQTVDINALVRELTTERSQMPFNISLVTKLDAALPPAQADPRRIQHLLSALFANAVEALESDTGFITVTTRPIHASLELLTTLGQVGLTEGDYFHLTVADTGHGMDIATLERIFEPFFSTKFTGRGLGLAAAQGIARSHKGGLSAESRLGFGSTLHLLLPLNRE